MGPRPAPPQSARPSLLSESPLCSASPCPSAEEGGLFSWPRDLQVEVEPWSLQVSEMHQA